jgi:hypothetical protein
MVDDVNGSESWVVEVVLVGQQLLANTLEV